MKEVVISFVEKVEKREKHFTNREEDELIRRDLFGNSKELAEEAVIKGKPND